MRNELTIIILLFLICFPDGLHASSCAVVENNIAAENAKVIFIGRVTNVDAMNRDKYPEGEYHNKCGDKFVTFTPSNYSI